MEKSMNKILQKTDEMVDVIKQNEKYKKYISIKQKISEDKDIMDLINEVKDLQKKIVNETYKGNDISSLQEKINKNMEILNSYPIYVEFNYLQEDLNEIFQHIKEKLQDNINKITL